MFIFTEISTSKLFASWNAKMENETKERLLYNYIRFSIVISQQIKRVKKIA